MGQEEKIGVGKKKSASEASRKVFWEGAALSPPQYLARLYFSCLTPFFAFFSHCGAWSQAIEMTVIPSKRVVN